MPAKKTLVALSQSTAALVAAAARASVPVTLSTGGEISVRGLGALEFIQVLGRFPDLRDVLLGFIGADDRTEEERADLDVRAVLLEAFSGSGTEAIATLLAAAAGAPRDQELVDAFMQLGDDDLFEVFVTVADLTMPRGLSDFLSRIGSAATRLGLIVLRGESSPSAKAA